MSVLDVRSCKKEPVTEIVFSEHDSDTWIANRLIRWNRDESYVGIYEHTDEVGETGEYVLLKDREHAENLIKAIRAAINLEWLK